MLLKLYIENFVLIERLDLSFEKGFCVITGQTGAGKSILLDSILFCFGNKIFGIPIRNGSNSCKVKTEFLSNNKINAILSNNSIKTYDNITITCEQFSATKKKFFINDELAPVKIVQELFPILLELHSQHHHTALLDKSQHINILDDYADLHSLKSKLLDSYNNWKSLKKTQDTYNLRQEEIKQDIDYLDHICQELEKLAIEEGEEQKLVERKRKLQSSDKEHQMVSSLIDELGNCSIEQILFTFQKNQSQFDGSPEYEKISENLDQLYDKLEDTKSILNDIIYQIKSPEYTMSEVEDRLYEIRDLARKHSIQPSELNEFLAKSQNKLDSLKSEVTNAKQTDDDLIKSEKEYNDLAIKLSEERKKHSDILSKKVTSELKFLDMKKAVFNIDVKQKSNIQLSNGIDEVKFVAATNPGSDLNSIDKVASGGELARFMLALRVSLFNKAPKKTIIFDEVDVGISGSVADSVGERIKDLSNAVQVIVITHQPQVAGKAKQHILVEKTQGLDYTISKVKILDEEARSLEIARMISGQKITDVGIQAAKELLNLKKANSNDI